MRFAPITDRLKDLGGDKWAIHNAARDRTARGEAIIALTVGEPDITPDPGLVDICADAMRGGRTRYSNGRGETGLVTALCQTYAPRMPGIGPSNVLCFPGTQTALFAVILALTDKGDGVLIGDPYYATYDGVVRTTGAHVQPVPLRMERDFVLDPDDLRAAVTPESRVLLLNTPHNPTGAVIDRATMRTIGQVAIEHDLWIVCDEVYESLIFAGEFVSPLEMAELRERTIVVSSISKSHAATGFRSGWAIGPAPFMERLLPISETMLFGNQPFIADMTEAALLGDYDTSERLRTALGRRARLAHGIVAATPALSACLPQGGMFMMVDVSATGLDGEAFGWRLLKEENVAIMPGSAFGSRAGHLIRVALTVPDDVLGDALGRMAALASRLARQNTPEHA
ncbi:pyridoxal phosphate-dependent aminotransferase [Falsirhodobacter halotolerans]|uniref:pyridoxal phosphate-dependent aminotransferase n=1 Tax=Falsirhodobacter halotolerans TaxID=1146892 RepID=UPI001FCFADC0|nr:pyridoxal phosphate-dependent aminotransferase [Falsirhodobacter halotolerans]MCJ8139169.1 pyridoxal phosphate-dependent aminotransferase [Falsirhodobacter halotolerans]